MANPFFNALGGGNTPVGRFQQMMQQFNQFRSSFQGDPKQRWKNFCSPAG